MTRGCGVVAERAIDDLVAGRQREVLLGRALGIVGLGFGGRRRVRHRWTRHPRPCLVLRRFDCCVISGLDGVSRRRFRYVFVDDGDFEAGHQEAGLTHAVDELFARTWRPAQAISLIIPVTEYGYQWFWEIPLPMISSSVGRFLRVRLNGNSETDWPGRHPCIRQG